MSEEKLHVLVVFMNVLDNRFEAVSFEQYGGPE
jgi:hypothetical protein